MAHHLQITAATGMTVYFCDPHSPWQRATNENSNGLLQQHFPQDINLRQHCAEDPAAVQAELNNRPRKTLGWQSPQPHSTSYSQPVRKPLLRCSLEFARYVSADYTTCLEAAGVILSAAGRPWDHATAESSFATIENEFVRRTTWPTHSAADLAVFSYTLAPEKVEGL